MNETQAMLELQHLKKFFPVEKKVNGQKAVVKAVNDVSLQVHRNEVYGLVGETGCGKSTLGRTMLRLLEPTDGRILYQGEDITKIHQQAFRQYRSKLQMIFQDPYTSLNPRKNVGEILTEVLAIQHVGNRADWMNMALDIIEKVGLKPEHYYRYPHEFSGGQRQRIGIARALILHPEFVVCDEPVSALDVSVQSQIINLLLDLKEKENLSYHDRKPCALRSRRRNIKRRRGNYRIPPLASGRSKHHAIRKADSGRKSRSLLLQGIILMRLRISPSIHTTI